MKNATACAWAVLCLVLPGRASEFGAEIAAHHRDFQSEGEGIAAVRLTGDNREFVNVGTLGSGGPAIDEDTLFEIGSITKTFTGILLADTVLKKKAALDDAVSKFLPAALLPADSPLHQITLLDLATHQSGLPRLPADLEKGASSTDPYAHYSIESLHRYLAELRESDLRGKGETHYSNLGVGLLGHLLERIWEKPYEDLVEVALFEPLGMKSSFVQRSPDSVPAAARSRLATGHAGGREVPPWHIDALCGAGAIVSSTRDLAAFAAAHWSTGTPPALRAALELAARVHRAPVGLGWFHDGEVIQHDGGTGGFRSTIRISVPDKSATIRLMNSTESAGREERSGEFSSLSGIWEGVLDTGAAKLTLVMRIGGDGRVVIHSLEQGGAGLQAGKSVHKDGVFRAVFPLIGGKFEGKREGGDLVGTWSQGSELPLRLSRRGELPASLREILANRAHGDFSKMGGWWSGFLGGPSGLFLILEIDAVGDLAEARVYSPDQTPEAIPVDRISWDGKVFTLAIQAIGAGFEARLSENRLRGEWKQGPVSQALLLERSQDRPARP